MALAVSMGSSEHSLSLALPDNLRILCPSWSSSLDEESEAECSSPSTPRQPLAASSAASPPPAPRKPTARVADSIPCFFEQFQQSPASSETTEQPAFPAAELSSLSSQSSGCSTPRGQRTRVVCPDAPHRNNSITSFDRSSLFASAPASSSPSAAAPQVVFTPAGTPCCLTQRSPSVHRKLLPSFNSIAVPATPQNTDELPGCPATMSLWMRRLLTGSSPTTVPPTPAAATLCAEPADPAAASAFAAACPSPLPAACFNTPVKPRPAAAFSFSPAPSPCVKTPQLFARTMPHRPASVLDLAAAAEWIADGRTPARRSESLPIMRQPVPDLSSPPAKRRRRAPEAHTPQQVHSIVQQEIASLRLTLEARATQH